MPSVDPVALFSENSAPVSALVWWLIPITALFGALIYAFWVARLKNRYENQTSRSVGRFQRFQESFQKKSTEPTSDQIKEPGKSE